MSTTATSFDYPAVLSDLWARHLAPRAHDAPTVIETFAGTGGSSLGHSAAGFRELLAVEWDDNAVASFRLNFPDVPMHHGDIAKLSVDDVIARTGLRPGELDVFSGSPPCQGFSVSGKRKFGDPRNQLFREYVRLLRGLRPRVFIMENVAGMVRGSMKLIFADVLRELKASGYRVSARVLNASYFQCPQARERMIFIGTRDDLNIEPTHPAPVSAPVTVRQAWAGLPDQHGDPLHGHSLNVARYVLPGNPNGGAARVSQWQRGKVVGFNLRRLDWNKPASTITKMTVLGTAPIVHPDRLERITISQCRRICAFPDQFQLVGNFNQQWSRLGNSVLPMFMYHVSRHVRHSILEREVA